MQINLRFNLKRANKHKNKHFTHTKGVKRCLFIFFIMLSFAAIIACPELAANASVPVKAGETIEFTYNDRVFFYDLATNKKQSTQFDINYEINKYNRFGSYAERKMLLEKMLKIGLEKSVAVEYLFPNLSAVVKRIEKNVAVTPQDAQLSVNTSAERVFKITPERIGCKLDKPALYSNLISAYLKNAPLKIPVPTTEILPKIFAKDYEKYTHLRADFSTNIASSSADRKHNIKNALNSLNKVEIAPNQIFSFNKTVGKRTQANGYREAKIIVNNEFVDGLGGGVCQVSTTLYNSALLAGLDIVEANKHSKQITYVKYGFDAMVNFGSSDLKFKNNTNQKITIITTYTPKTARIRIYGEPLDCEYKLTNEIVSTTEPETEILYDEKGEYADKVTYTDEYFYLKKGIKGMEIKSYREKYVGGKLLSRELLRHDKFKVQNSVKIYGAKPRENNILIDFALPESA